MRSRPVHFLIITSVFLAVNISAFLYPQISYGTESKTSVQEAVEEVSGHEGELEFGLDFDFNSRYVWRGIYLSDGAVWQPYAWLTKWGITPSVWGNFVLNNEANQWKFNEVDLALTYQNKIGKLTVRPGFLYYFYPNTSFPSTGELSLYLSYPIGPFSLFTDQLFDIKEFKGAYYADFGISYKYDINAFLTFEGSVSTAWASSKFNESYFFVSKTASDNVNLNLGLVAQVASFLYVRPHLQYTVLTDTNIRDSFGEPNLFCIGVTVGANY